MTLKLNGMIKKILLSPPHMGGDELKFITEAFEMNWIAPMGPHIDNFEIALASYIGIDNCVALASGTSAIHLALIILGVGRGDEIICQSFTFSASANPIRYLDAIPIFIDSEKDSWNMDVNSLENAIKSRISLKKKKPKAVIVVHAYGMPAKIDEIASICKKYEISLIEDAAEALGSSYKGKMLGSFGDFGILSFNGNKIITTSCGGALLSNNSNFIEKARYLSTQARDFAPHYQHSQIGYNYRMSNICAAIGLGQMLILNDRIKTRRENYSYYFEQLGKIDGIDFLKETKGAYSNRWLTTLLFDETKLGVTREKIRLKLSTFNIESRPLWKPMHMQPIFSKYQYYGLNVSEQLFVNGLCLPSGSNLSMEDKKLIVKTIKSCLAEAEFT